MSRSVSFVANGKTLVQLGSAARITDLQRTPVIVVSCLPVAARVAKGKFYVYDISGLS